MSYLTITPSLINKTCRSLKTRFLIFFYFGLVLLWEILNPILGEYKILHLSCGEAKKSFWYIYIYMALFAFSLYIFYSVLCILLFIFCHWHLSHAFVILTVSYSLSSSLWIFKLTITYPSTVVAAIWGWIHGSTCPSTLLQDTTDIIQAFPYILSTTIQFS